MDFEGYRHYQYTITTASWIFGWGALLFFLLFDRASLAEIHTLIILIICLGLGGWGRWYYRKQKPEK